MSPAAQINKNESRVIPDVQQLRDIVLELFDNVGFDYKQAFVSEDIKLRKAMEDAVGFNDLSPQVRQAASTCFKVSYDFANCVYRHAPEEIRVLVGVYLFLLLYVADDTTPDRMLLLRDFSHKFLHHEPQGAPLFDLLPGVLLDDFTKHYGTSARTFMVKHCLDYLQSSFLEFQYPNGFTAINEAFPVWLRRKTGNSETFAFLMFPESMFPEDTHLSEFIVAIPDISDFFDTGNDVLSYYKERIVGSEENNFIANDAVMRGVTEVESLKATAKQVKVLVDRITKSLSPNKELLACWKSLYKGFFLYHFTQERYRLKEVL
ncbi:hypothetical protein E4U55_003205 [Claviceps digitariae]|nr:hypothetical protein E4U55_003205 [Claviceps digitariae]